MINLRTAQTRSPLRLAASGAALVLGLAAMGCSDSETVLAPPGGEPQEPGEEPEEPGDLPSAYLTAVWISAGDVDETYLVVTDSFDASTELEPTNGVQLLGNIVPVVHEGSVYVTDANAPVIQRYQLNDAGELEAAGQLSFLGVGVAEVVSWYTYVVSDTKGYVYDAGGPRLVGWNPSTMTLDGSEIDLSELERDGWSPNLVLEQMGPRRRGDELLIPTGWVDQDFNYRHATGLLVIDTATDSVVSVSEDERCGEAYMSVEAPNGDLYFFPSGDSAAQHYFAENFRPTCVLRVQDGENELDSEFSLDLSALGSGSAATGAVPDGGSGFFFASVDEALWEERENNGEAYWRFWHYDFESEVSREVPSMPAWAGSTYYSDVGGRAYIPYWVETETGYRTTLYDLNGADDPTPSFSFDASWGGFAQLR